MGSVKDLQIIVPPAPKAAGVGIFRFSDRYSVFDWGEMPDRVSEKGASLCVMSAYFFERMAEEGIQHHYEGVMDGAKCRKLMERVAPVEQMKVKLVQVFELRESEEGYDYRAYREGGQNILVPFEIVFRYAIPEESSAYKRLKEGKLSLKQFGLEGELTPGAELSQPLIEFFTKKEPLDRLLTQDEAEQIFPQVSLELLHALTQKVAALLKREAERAGLSLQDGKIECALDAQGNLMVVDTVGTLDECRFTCGGIPVSKELIRKVYRRTRWYQQLQEAREEGSEEALKRVGTPPSLPASFSRSLSLLYQAAANALTGKMFFPSVPSLRRAAEQIQEELDAISA